MKKVAGELKLLYSQYRDVEYNWLFDIPMAHAGKGFYEKAARKVAADSVGDFLRALQPEIGRAHV